MAKKIFGNKVTLRGRPQSMLYLEGSSHQFNPAVATQIFDKWVQRAVSTVQEYSDPTTGDRIRNVRTVIAVTPEGLFFDQIGDSCEPVDGLEYFVNGFNVNGYKANIKTAVDRACGWWASGKFDECIVADPKVLVNTKQRPV